jgi:putative mRNA 3-end processing factor
MFDFSSHAGNRQLMDVIKSSSALEKVIVVHASLDNAQHFAEMVKEELGVEVKVPENGEEIDI